MMREHKDGLWSTTEFLYLVRTDWKLFLVAMILTFVSLILILPSEIGIKKQNIKIQISNMVLKSITGKSKNEFSRDLCNSFKIYTRSAEVFGNHLRNEGSSFTVGDIVNYGDGAELSLEKLKGYAIQEFGLISSDSDYSQLNTTTPVVVEVVKDYITLELKNCLDRRVNGLKKEIEDINRIKASISNAVGIKKYVEYLEFSSVEIGESNLKFIGVLPSNISSENLEGSIRNLDTKINSLEAQISDGIQRYSRENLKALVGGIDLQQHLTLIRQEEDYVQRIKNRIILLMNLLLCFLFSLGLVISKTIFSSNKKYVQDT